MEYWHELAAGVGAHLESAKTWKVTPDQALELFQNPIFRAFALLVLVYLTIRVIASIYSGDMQNSEMGPIGIRPHAAQRLDRKTILLPRMLMPMNMEGVTADCKIHYAFTDARGKRRMHLIHTIENARIAVSPVRLTKVSATLYGQETPDVATADVCFPPVELDSPPQDISPTPERAIDYVAQNKILEAWKEDDDALLVSVHKDILEEIGAARRDFIVAEADKVRQAREGGFLARLGAKRAALRRPNVVGSFYLKFEFSHNPWFVLTRHPDRDLKMTAWLTVLTSVFSLVMEAWDVDRDRTQPRSAQAEQHSSGSRPTR